MILNPNGTFVWDEIWDGNAYARRDERQRRAHQRAAAFRIAEHLNQSDSILDVACGSGEFLSVVSGLMNSDSRLVGLDRSPIALKLAGLRNKTKSLQLVCGEATKLPLAAASVSNVVLFGIVEHIVEVDNLLVEVNRVLKPGGRVFISTSNALSALQIRNAVLAGMGRYPYGYQKNWRRLALVEAVKRIFTVETDFIEQADNDMPLIKFIDHIINAFNPFWGRYICVQARKVAYSE